MSTNRYEDNKEIVEENVYFKNYLNIPHLKSIGEESSVTPMRLINK
jgi:hypothetical protein